MEIESHTTYKITENISLTETEANIINIFKNFVDDKKLKTTIRIAGGWVRDKVLGRESSDIDFAIDNMTGEEFVKLAIDSLKQQGNARGFGVTKFNPEKSKHLETATIEILGVWIDVVNLRGESYNENSRVPEIVIGTPEQDAYRRDLTINSLFYNIHTGKIEDFTGRGLPDLRDGLARTPLPPVQTFIDDPLRILRTIRFVSRFDLKLDESIIEAFHKPEIMEGLLKKVSKERVRTELQTMLSNVSAFTSITMFNKFNVFPYMIEIPLACQDLAQNPDKIFSLFQQSFVMCNTLQRFVSNKDDFELVDTMRNYFKLPEIRCLLYMCAILEPFTTYKVLVNPKTQKTEPLVFNLMKSELKYTNDESTIVGLATANRDEFKRLCKDFIEGKNVIIPLTKLIVKDFKQFAKTWELGFILAFISDIVYNLEESQKVIECYKKFYQYINNNNLNQLFNVKPYLDGGQIQQLFPQVKGPSIQTIKDNAFYWQIENPTKDIEDLKAYIAEHRDEFLADRLQ